MRWSLMGLWAAACTAKAPVSTPVDAPAPAAPVAVIQSPLDARAYRLITLDNGLRALLVHDDDTDMAAAAMFVHVGHYADPEDRQGLAHFLEHMLFMGTDKYPDVDGYRKFIEDHGGSTNAGTSAESTLYHFEVEQSALPEAFDRFARFFVAPLFDRTYVDRERNAVNSEYTLKVQDADRRSRQVRKVTTNPAHPEHLFSTGNLDTLADRDGDSVYDDLKALYASAYHPSVMTLAVVGRQSLDELEALVHGGLDGAGGGAAAPVPPPAVRPPPYLPDQLGVRIDLTALDVRRELALEFPLPPDRPAVPGAAPWPFAPIGYVSSMLGDESEGTLFTALKDAGWIESLSASSADAADDHDLLSIDIDLTEAGVGHIDDIIAAVLAAARQMAVDGVTASRHDEERVIGELAFRFAEETQPVGLVQAAASALHEVPPEHVLDHWSLAGTFDPDLVKARLAALTPENLRAIVTLPASAGVATDRKEPLYDVPYAVRPFTDAEKAKYTGASPIAFGMPAPNPYIPRSTDLVPGGDTPGIPTLRSAPDARVELWHLLDTAFGVPRTYGTIDLWTPAPRTSDLKSRVMVRLYARLLEDALQAFRYPPQRVGRGFQIAGNADGLAITFFGYSDQQDAFLRDLLHRIATFEVDPARFAIQRDRMVREWKNLDRERPLTQVRYAESEGLFPLGFDRAKMLPIAEKLTAKDLEAFVAGFYDQVRARMLVHGDVDGAGADALAAIVQAELLGDHRVAARPDVSVRRPPPGKTIVRDVAVDHDDSAITVVYVGAQPDTVTQAKFALLGQLLDTPFFTQLRTEQQLGYAVSASYARFDLLPGVRLSIQSGVAGPVTLLERIDAFLASQQQIVAAMDPAAFATIRAGLSASLREKRTQLYTRSGDLVSDLRDGITTFDGNVRLADEVDKLDRDTMAAFYAEVLRSPAYGRVVTRSFGRKHVAEKPKGAGCDTACMVKGLSLTWSRVR